MSDKLKVFVEPVGIYSPAMVRIARALELYAPENIEIVKQESAADVAILYVIGRDYLDRGKNILARGRSYAIVQCCLETAGFNYSAESVNEWCELWSRSLAVWSYYNLEDLVNENQFMYAPLGIDAVFTSAASKSSLKSDYVVTTGCVSGSRAEAIEEVWLAAKIAGLRSVHVGPEKVQGTIYRADEILTGISDFQLATIYQQAQWVCALRHVEGFELPALEALACGTRPILFDQPDLRHWYGRHAIYIPECRDEELVDRLVKLFKLPQPSPMTESERLMVIDEFNWKPIAQKFWLKVVA